MDHLRALIDHMQSADAAVLRSLEQAGAPPRALTIYLHVLGAEHVWLSRLEQRQRTVEVWPTGDLARCRTLARENADGFRAYVERLAPGDLRRSVHYRNSAGQEFDSAIEDILLHVALHGNYHRGQVTMLVRDAGLEPEPTDFIAFVRGVPAAKTVPPSADPAHRR